MMRNLHLHFHVLLLAILLILGIVSARQINHRVVLRMRQTQEESRTRGTCTQMSNKCHLPDRDDQVCPADYNRDLQCPFDGSPCVLIEPKGDSSRKAEIRCGYLGIQGA
ncbi:uncharacterized protein CTRU02_212646 [Colletotrichum truncatum]|uniref:Uncharacterized protein n=1 Tax=Colletotrichum truncatum TaxID=5467 RepID=A0ACC3YIG8_COLTU|nr:uncharacterized protein CTRU02_05282 [Colletotrichum truncatum]KAF6794450.1 hypothetical protein CTRU02_05282 [Colletotrichum truncatum]